MDARKFGKKIDDYLKIFLEKLKTTEDFST